MAKKKKKPNRKYDPELDTSEKSPIRIRIAAGDVNDKYSGYPSSGLTPARLAQIFREADAGDVLRQMELFEEMEEKDTHLFSQLQTRKLAVTGLEWEVQPYSDAPADKAVAAFVEEQLNGMERLEEIFLDMLDAIGKGISILEIEWGVKDGCNVIENLEWVHQKKLVWDSMEDELLICTRDHPSGIPLPENKFVVHKYKAKSGHDSRAGVLRVVSWMYLFKNYTLKDWVSFCEIFGMPIRLGKYNQAASEDDKRQLIEAIYSIGSDAAGIIPDSAVIEFIEANKTSTVDIYEKLARYCDEQISKAVLGQTLTSDSGGGSYAQGKVHNDVRKDLTIADAKSLAATFRRDVIRPLVEYNFGTDAQIPLFDFNCEEPEELKDTAEIYRTLACDIGLKIPAGHVYEVFNIPKPKEGEQLLEPGARMANLEVQAKEYPMKVPKPDKSQEQIDRIVELSSEQASKLFEKMMEPLKELVSKAGSMESLQEALKDQKTVKELYGKIDLIELQDLIAQGMYLSHLLGRTEDMDGDP